ncbi:uncharacterized protein LOC126763918 [Bactrocera neohumeralis]|nr:uncharacterized protein LOC126763918 [Bactrocera neohumeralis]
MINLLDMNSSNEEDEAIENFNSYMLCVLNNRRGVHLGIPKSCECEQTVLRKFDDNRFYQMVRVRPEEFCYILNLIKHDEVFNTSSREVQLPVELQFKIVLYRLGSSGEGQSVRKVAFLFGVGDGALFSILKLKSKFLFWTHERERQQIVSSTSTEMPGCVGYVDGSEVKLSEAPVNEHTMYYSRKRQYAVKLQAICDYKLRIRQLIVGYPGSVHDAKIFSNCLLFKHPERFLSTSQWIAGDSAYPLKPFLITSFRQNSSEYTEEERHSFNKYFSKYRICLWSFERKIR